MNITQILWIIIPAVSMILYGALIYLQRNQRREEERWFTAFLVAAFVWSMGSMLLHANLGFVNPQQTMQFLLIGYLAVPVTIFGFTIQFLSLRQLQWWSAFGIFFYILVQLLNLLGLIAPQVYVTDKGLVSFQPGWGIYIVGVYFSIFIYASAYFLVRELRRTEDKVFRNRLQYIFVVLILLWLGLIANATPLGQYPVDLLMAALAASLITVSMSRYQFLEMRHTAIRLSALLLIILVYIAVVSMGIYAVGQVQQPYLAYVGLMAATLSAILVFGYQPVRAGLLGFIERVLLPRRYDIEKLMFAISGISKRLLPLETLSAELLDEIHSALHLEAVSLILHHEHEEGFKAVAAVGLPTDTLQVQFRDDSPLVRELAQHHSAMHVGRLRELPRLRALWIEEWNTVAALKAVVFVPIWGEGGHLDGFIVLGAKRGGEPYTRQETQTTLPTLASQISIALANSRMFAQEQARADALAQANEELRRVDLMKDELIQTVSHELRTPLSIVHGYAELLSNEQTIQSGLSTEDIADTILQQSQRLVLLVNDILLLTQIGMESTSFEPVEMDTLVQKCCYEMAFTTNRPIDMESIAPSGSIPLVMGVGHRLRQVVDNLLTNALKFSPDGGTVHVSVYEEEGSVVTAVRDEGVGISAEEQEYVWDRFYQSGAALTRNKRGVGLGLAIAKKIVEWHGGWIGLESEEGQGAIFRFGLPIVEDDPTDHVDMVSLDDTTP
jgi:signal transduction histidine kinase